MNTGITMDQNSERSTQKLRRLDNVWNIATAS